MGLPGEAVIAGAGQHEWVWAAIASGDLSVVRAAPASFDINSVHPRYGSVLTAFLQGLLNMEGRFIAESDRGRRAKDLVEELGRRAARPDLAIPCANLRVKGLYRDWRISGDVTPMQVVIQMRNDLLNFKFETQGEMEESEEGAMGDARILGEIIDKYAGLVVAIPAMARSFIPDVVVNIWERCLEDTSTADVEIASPDGRSSAHCLLLSRASPVIAAMLASGMREGERREVAVDESARVVRLFLALLYTGCFPADAGGQSSEPPELEEGTRVVVAMAFMSNSSKSVLLPLGLEGTVCSLDKAGDAFIRFNTLTARQWVTRRNFWRLRLAGAPGTAGQLQEDLAGALALARRWQVGGLADVLEDRLERSLAAEGFEAALEVAELHGAARLRAACLALARNSSQVRASFDAGEYGPTACVALETVYGPSGPRKRAREAI